ncbi:MAG: T9SS type A sorting domain-containing protein, partial [Flavobacteriales bacterium]|nr:T9SS type A sorting domain-containing protein [Flavobacteriales bacterium]
PGGGDICADLDVAGAPVMVEECACAAFAGTMSTMNTDVCSDGTTTISAMPNGDAIIPAGYAQVYVLTQGEGLVIVNAGAEPSFEVEGGGLYTIHSLVFDPNTLDLGIVELGVTTGVDVFGLIIPGGGEICADLDVAGAPITIQNPSAGTLISDEWLACYDGTGAAYLSASIGNDPIVPAGYEVLYVLTNGWDLTILNVNTTPQFDVEQTGVYRIHTLVYDPATLDLGIVEIGSTTGFDVNGLLVQGGGDICASLDVSGALFLVAPQWLCDLVNSLYHNATAADVPALEKILTSGSDVSAEQLQEIMDQPAFDISVFPNPTLGDAQISVNAGGDIQLFVQVFDMSGRMVHEGDVINSTKGISQWDIDLNSLEAGVYNLILRNGNYSKTQRIVKQ